MYSIAATLRKAPATQPPPDAQSRQLSLAAYTQQGVPLPRPPPLPPPAPAAAAPVQQAHTGQPAPRPPPLPAQQPPPAAGQQPGAAPASSKAEPCMAYAPPDHAAYDAVQAVAEPPDLPPTEKVNPAAVGLWCPCC